MMSPQSHIIPVPVGDPLLCRHAATLLLENFAIYVQPISDGETVAYRIGYAVLGHPSFLDGVASEIRLAGLRRSD